MEGLRERMVKTILWEPSKHHLGYFCNDIIMCRVTGQAQLDSTGVEKDHSRWIEH